MSEKIAIITVHGMGDTPKNYNESLVEKLEKYVGDEWRNNVHVERVFYQNLLQGKQEKFWKAINRKYRLGGNFLRKLRNLRKFILYSFSDAATIEHSLHTKNQKLYLAVHRKIATAFDNCYKRNKEMVVIVIAQSLGGEQISNYIWDAMEGKRLFEKEKPSEIPQKQFEFRKLSTCVLLVTTGCNIPVFRAALHDPELFKHPNKKFMWKNYFDADDVLGYPIKDMSDSYNQDWVEDIKVGVGRFSTRRTPCSHTKYWKDKAVLKPIAEIIKAYLAISSP